MNIFKMSVFKFTKYCFTYYYWSKCYIFLKIKIGFHSNGVLDHETIKQINQSIIILGHMKPKGPSIGTLAQTIQKKHNTNCYIY